MVEEVMPAGWSRATREQRGGWEEKERLLHRVKKGQHLIDKGGEEERLFFGGRENDFNGCRFRTCFAEIFFS